MKTLVKLLSLLIKEYGVERFKTAAELALLNNMPRGPSLAALQIEAMANNLASASVKVRRIRATRKFLFDDAPYTLRDAKEWVEANYLDNGYGPIRVV